MKLARVLALLLLAGCGGGSSHDPAPPPATAGGEGWITRTAPTSAATYFASEWTVTLEGEAFFDAWSYSGEVAPPVRWTNRQAGVSGTAFDTVTWEQFLWTIYPAQRVWHAVVPLVGGENEIIVTAGSGANWARTTLTVTHAPGSNPPSVGIDPVAPGSPLATNTTPLVLHGSAAGYLGIASVAWSNAAGNTAGLAEGAAHWTAAIPLLPGENAITITAFDRAGTAASASAVITYDPARTGPFPSAPVGLAAAAGDGVAVVQWEAAPEVLSYNVYWAAAGGVRKATYASLPEGGMLRGVTAPCAIAGLRNEAAYRFVVTAVDAVGEGVESAEVGTTPTAGATCPATGEASLVTGTTARLNGRLIAPSALATSAWFEYGPTPALGSATAEETVAAAEGAVFTEVFADLAGLAPGTTCYFRLATRNSAGTFAGATRTCFTPTAPEVLVTGLDAVTDLAADATGVYWVEVYGRAVRKRAKDSGTVTVLGAIESGNSASLAIDGERIVFADYGSIWEASLAGGEPVRVIGGRRAVTRLRLFGAAIYWREDGAVRTIDRTSGVVTTLATGPTSPAPFVGGLAVDADAVYLTDLWEGAVFRAAKDGSVCATLFTGLERPSVLCADGGTVFVADARAIRTLPTTGGEIATLAAGVAPGFMVAYAAHIYFTDNDRTIRSIDLASGQMATLVTGEPGFCGLAVDADSVYWVTPGDRYSSGYGALKRIARP